MAENLPDLFLLSVFQKLGANDRLNASQVCTNWYHRVREVNKDIRCLTIITTLGEDGIIQSAPEVEEACFRFNIDRYTFGYTPSIKKVLMKEENLEKEEADKERLESSTKYNTLEFSGVFTSGAQLNSNTVQKVISIFLSISELNFISQSKDVATYEYLVEMLELDDDQDQDNNKSWGQQLTALRIIDLKGTCDLPLTSKLFTAINRLPLLKRLAIVIDNHDESRLKLLNLPILARLEEIRFKPYREKDIVPMLGFVKHLAAKNTLLKLDLPNAYSQFFQSLPESSQKYETSHLRDPNFRAKVIRLNDYDSISCLNLNSIGHYFPHLTSVSVNCNSPHLFVCMVAFLSRLNHLRHLKISIDFERTYHTNFKDNDLKGAQKPSLFKPTRPLLSVKALELLCMIDSHFTIQWLNLSAVVPNIKAIHFRCYFCNKCNVNFYGCNTEILRTSLNEREVIQNCLGAVFEQLCHNFPDLSLEKITIKTNESNVISAKQLLDY